MRRKDREVSSDLAYQWLCECEYATMRLVSPGNTPYAVPVSPAVVGKDVYIHCALEGTKLDILRQNPQVVLSCVGQTQLQPEEYTTAFASAVAFGRAQIVTDETEKIEALRAICLKYAPSHMDKFDEAIKRSLHRTGIIKITLERLYGKQKPLKPAK